MSRQQGRLRDHLPLTPRHEPIFRWRSHEITRIEGFADAVFAFAVTLLIVALEVPHTFEGLMGVLHEFPGFVASFALLMLFWNAHYRFFRRYGLQDPTTVWLNFAILLMVLFSVYPLKFLFSAWLGSGPHKAHLESVSELSAVYQFYGLGLGLIWGCYALLYWNALRQRDYLRLSPAETELTRGSCRQYLICVGVSLVSVLLARFRQADDGYPGLVFASLIVLLPLNTYWHRKRAEVLFPPREERRH